jgi:C-22 sterol desaturase
MASPMETFNASQTSFPETIHATISSPQTGLLGKMLESTSIFGVFLTLFAVAVAYDQSMY